MNIGHYMTGVTDAGGIGSYIRRVSVAQRKMGHEVFLLDRIGHTSEDQSVVLTRDDADLFQIARDKGLDILHLHTVVDPSASVEGVKIVRTMHGHWPYCPSGGRYLRRQNVACDRAYSLLGCTWGHIVDRCGSVRPAGFAQGFERTWREMRTLPGHRVLAISNFVKSQMIRSGYPEKNIHLLYLPAPEVSSAIPPTFVTPATPSFLFLARLVPEKGGDWLLRAAAQVVGSFVLDIAGQGPERQRLEQLAEQLGIAQRVRFHGWLNEMRVLDLMQVCRAVIFPSLWHEPAGLVTLEAAAAARPVICSRVGGIPEYAERLGNGIQVDPGDIPALARAMQRMLDDPAEAARLGEKGRVAAAGPLSLNTHLESLHRHYSETIQSR